MANSAKADAAEREADVPSPCIGVCRVDGADVCVGCGRTIDEICGWIESGAERRRAIVRLARQRLEARRAVRGSEPIEPRE